MGTELRRQIYASLMRCYSCFPENCKEKRAVHVASGAPFSCEHYNVVKSCSLPTSAKNLQEEDIKSYNSDNSTQRMLLDALQPPEDFRHVVQILKAAMPYITVIPRAHLTPQGIVMFRSMIDSSAAQTEAVQSTVVTANRWSCEPFAPFFIFFFVCWKCQLTQVQLTLHLYQHPVNPIRTFLYFCIFGFWSGTASLRPLNHHLH